MSYHGDLSGESIVAEIDDLAALTGVSIYAACIRAGVKPSTVSRWRSGEHEPSIRTYRRLREAFHELARERRGA